MLERHGDTLYTVYVGGLAPRDPTPGYCCPYCKEQVGYVGRFLAWIFGTQFHGCDFSNVMHPAEINEELHALSSSQGRVE